MRFFILQDGRTVNVDLVELITPPDKFEDIVDKVIRYQFVIYFRKNSWVFDYPTMELAMKDHDKLVSFCINQPPL